MIKTNNVRITYLVLSLFYAGLALGQTTLPSGLFATGSQQIPLVNVYKERAYGYEQETGIPQNTADSMANPKLSNLRLFEIWPDGSAKELGPAHSRHDYIINQGGGRFSHWHNGTGNAYLVFSASDATNPLTNGRSYLAVLPGADSSSDKVASSYDDQNNTWRYYLSTSDPAHRTIIISNPSSYSYTFNLAFNQDAFLQSTADLKTVIQNQVPEFAGESIERKVWRFARDNRIHRTPYTGALWYHHPLMLYNSAGFGYCDDVASSEVHMWALWGYEGRVWGLNSALMGGHVVAEVNTNGRWHLYDGDYQVYFMDGSGSSNVASVSSLISQNSLITTPFQVAPFTPVKLNKVGKPALYSTLYNSSDFISSWYNQMPLAEDRLKIDLPTDASVEIGWHGASDAPTTFSGGNLSNQTDYSSLKVSLPSGSVGDLQVFLIPYMIKGSGSVTLYYQNGVVRTVPISSTTDWNKYNANYRDNYIKKISYTVGTGGMQIYYMTNPLRSSIKGFNSLILKPDPDMPMALVNPLTVKFGTQP
jgi:hypothetical protein